ncbi:MAG: Nif3-like dinuclear metal center hexameric protein [Lactobacillales bacterium]|jgi:dinuclear metal center YbgI/SA1388 family protein|nr:Nif3-like dinuclear metal center hexameric protein [Lactobacillales bacterium]
MLASEFIEVFDAYCPPALAEAGDPVGLHIGTLNKPIERVMVTLDIRPETVTEAIENKADLVIAKHPPIFRPAKRLNTDNPQNKMYADLLKHEIAVYAAHTNLDIIENGLNDWFCELLGIKETSFLTKTHELDGKEYGIGRVGNLSTPLNLNDFAKKVKKDFRLDGLRLVTQHPEKLVKRVAICGGSGEKFYPDALAKQADVYITGDIYYHTAHDMLANGLSAIDPGHHVEYLCVPKLVELFNEWKNEFDWSIEFIESKANTNPFQFM